MAISDRILLLNNGKIEQQGTPQEIYGSPKTLFTAEFMGSNNRLHGKVTEVRTSQSTRRCTSRSIDWAWASK